MGLGHLHEDQRDAVGIGHVHFVQTPRFLPGFAGDWHAAVGQLLLGGVDVAHLEPQRAARVRFAVAGKLDQRLTGVEDRARAVVAGDRQAELVAVEAQRALVVGRPEEHSAGQDLHGSVSITSGAGFGRDTVCQEPGCSRWRFISVLTQPGATLSRALAVTAIRGAMRTGRVRAAVTIQSAASAGVSAGRPL